MTVIVGLSIIITQPLQGITCRDVLGKFLHEFLRTVPYRRDGFRIFVQTYYKTILFLIFRHNLERIEANVTVELDTWLDTPVPFVVLHQGLTEKETRFEAAHVSVADGVSIDDLPLCHVFSHLFRFVLIYEVWV